MLRNNILILALTFAMVGSLVTPKSVISEPLESTPSQPGQDRGLMSRLNLTSGQMNKLKAIRKKYHSSIIEMGKPLQDAQQQLNTLMGGNASEDVVRSKYEEVAKLREQLNSLRFASMVEMRQVLTTAQRTQLVQLMEQRRTARPQLQNNLQLFNADCPEKLPKE